MRLHLCGVAVLVAAVLSGFVTASGQGAATSGRIDFDRDIRPLLSDRCFRCHGPDAAKREAELRLDARAGLFRKMGAGRAVVKPGDPAKSELVRRIFTDDLEEMMPPGLSRGVRSCFLHVCPVFRGQTCKKQDLTPSRAPVAA